MIPPRLVKLRLNDRRKLDPGCGGGGKERGRIEENPPLMTDTLKFLFILRIRLDPQTGREHKLPDRSAEAGEEGIERLFRVSPIRVSMRFFSSLNPAIHFRSQLLPTWVRCGRVRIPELGGSIWERRKKKKTAMMILMKDNKRKHQKKEKHPHNSPQAHNTQTAARPPRPKTP